MSILKTTRAADARERMIARQLRTDSAVNVPPEINAGLDMDQFMRSERRFGLRCLCENAELKERLYDAALLPFAVFGERLALKNLTGLFLFDAEEQESHYATCGGMTQRYLTNNGIWGYKVGIAAHVVRYSKEWCTFVILHEFCHVINWTLFGHEVHWHGALDAMLAEFNTATGMNIRNDYDQLYQ